MISRSQSLRRLSPLFILAFLMGVAGTITVQASVVDTGQNKCYDDSGKITCPVSGQAFHGQDAQYSGDQPEYIISGDDLTVYDQVTGLTWQKSPDIDGDGDIDADDKLNWAECQAYPDALNAASFGGHTDWRLPTIKELYSLIDFSGTDPSGYSGSTSGLVPFIDTDYFDFAYGDESAGERIIDSQYASSSLYVGNSDLGQLLFGVNFADGRIKGYGLTMPGGLEKTFFVICTRGDSSFGINDFIDNGDGTVTDVSTNLMWMKDDSGTGYDWEEALDYAESLVYATHDDWRLPNAKELQGIVDYTRSPSTTGSAAIDTVFNCTPITDEAGGTNYAFYWSSTTHANWTADEGYYGAYVAFGEALGYMDGGWLDVHGAGAQRSDPKSGDPADWPTGHGPQGDAIRIFNFVRCVRDATPTEVGEIDSDASVPSSFTLSQNRPNPFNPATTIAFSLPEAGRAHMRVFNVAGESVATIVDAHLSAGEHRYLWQPETMPSGIYFCTVESGTHRETVKMLLLR